MKKKMIGGLVLSLGLLLVGPAALVQANELSYWSEKNAPLIYGASEITIPQGTNFDVKDTRFRVFAKDFEDGDLTQSIVVTENVNEDIVGRYTISYLVEDQHGNETQLSVPVNVVSAETTEITVKRLMYTIPNVSNMDQAGTNRNNYGDRQHLGIYLPAGKTVSIRLLEGTKNLTLNFFGNDGKQETQKAVNSNWQTFSNTLDSGESYDSIPLLISPVMEKGTDINKTFTIEIKYSNEVKELDYHHRGDKEEKFFNNWKTSKNTFGLIESNEITVVVPFIDVDMLINYHKKGFTSLEQFYDYWQKVVNKMDYIIGLELNPDNPVHQNVPARYVVKANRNGAGSAYYSGNHVGVNSEHVYSFFEMNWGGLHEFAHGYQGSLGKGVMGLGEVSNNIIGHYIQINKDIYFHDGDWLGDFTKREAEFNSSRLEGKTWDSHSVDKRLYMVCNLLDHFKGEDTYRDIFRWYREQLNAGRTLTNTDAYVEAIAELEGVNIVPYMQAWGLAVGEETRNKVYNSRLPLLTILGDMLSEDTQPSIMAENQITEKFEPVENDVLKTVSGRVNITFEINDFESIRNKTLVVFDGKEVIKEVTVTEETVSLELPVGGYTLYAPISNLASNNAEYLTVKEGENEAVITYSDFSEHKYDTSVVFKVQGIHGTYGYQLSFNEDYTKATATLNGSDMGSTEPYVKIYRADGTLVEEETVTRTNNEYYFDVARKTYDVEFQPGDYIEIYHPNYANKVTVHSNLNGSKIAAFTPVSALTKYTIVEGGIVMNEMTKEEAVEINYELLKAELTKLIEDYRNEVSEEELADVSANRPMKDKVLTAYLNLHTEDQTEYTEFVEKLKEQNVESGMGGTKEASATLYVTTPGTARIAAGYDIEEFLYESVSAYDYDFNKITLTKDNIAISTQLDVETPGTYTVDYTVTAGGASGTATLTVVVYED